MSQMDHTPLFCMFKGEPGTRKSTAALSFPKPMYWFSYDQKMESLILPMRAWNINPGEIEYDDYTNYDKMSFKLEQFQSKCPFKTLVFDSVTSMGDSINRQTLKLKGTDSKGKKIGGIQVNSIEDFNAEMSAFQELMALTKDIHKYHKINVVIIAHIIQTEQKSPDGKTHMSRTIITGGKKAGAKIAAYCTEIYHFNISQGVKGADYGVLTQHTGDDFARTSLPLPMKIQMDDKPLYDNWLLPAINQLKPSTSAASASSEKS